MFGYTIIRTDRLDHLLATERAFDRTFKSAMEQADQIGCLRDSLNETLEAKARLEDKLTAALTEIKQERETAGRILQRNIAVQARLDVVGAELDHWRKHGQLRDPATGRLIPRAKTKVA